MKQKLIITKGLPASGKTTWAKEQVKQGQGQVKRVNKDDLREMIDGGAHSKGREDKIVSAEIDLAEHYLVRGDTVIVDDTNFNHIDRWESVALQNHVDFEVKDFSDVPLDVCIKRNQEREKSIPTTSIKDMYFRHIRKAPEYEDSHYIICDIDGTLAHMEGRSPYEGSRVAEDKVDNPIRAILIAFELSIDAKIIIVSAREDKYSSQTIRWLKENNVPYHGLYFRPTGDYREDSIVKEEILQSIMQKEEGKKPLFVLDDRKRVVDMWRRNGIKCLQVEEGDF